MKIKELRRDGELRLKTATAAAIWINAVYALGNLTLGIIDRSYWFITAGVYFLVLALMRSFCASAARSNDPRAKYIGRLVGVLLMLLGITIAGSVILSDRFDVIEPTNKIIMIAIAAFTTFKTALAAVNSVKARRGGDPVLIALRNVSCADAAASVLSLQRSMLVSFREMPLDVVRLMNALTGAGVCLVIFALGFFSLKKKY